MAGSFFISCNKDGMNTGKLYYNKLKYYYSKFRNQECIGEIEKELFFASKYNRFAKNSYVPFKDENGNIIIIDGVVIFEKYEDQNFIQKIILDEYIKNGNEVFKNIQGHFVITILNCDSNDIVVVTDINGMLDKYIYTDNKLIVFCSSLLSLAKTASVNLNYTSIAEMFQFGQFICLNTYYEKILRVEPATIYTIRGNSIISKNNYWHYPKTVKHDLRFKYHVLEIERRLKNVMDIICRSFKNIEYDITGGTDSRLILAAVRSNRNQYNTSFFDPVGTEEYKVVRKIISNCSIPFDHHYYDGDWPKNIEIDDIVPLVGLCDGRIDPLDIFTTYYNQMLRINKGIKVSINGIAVGFKEGWSEEMRIFKRRKYGIDYNTILKYRLYKNITRNVDIFDNNFKLYLNNAYNDAYNNIEYTAKELKGIVTPLATDIFYFNLVGHDDIASQFNISNQILTTISPLMLRNIIEQIGIGDPKWKKWYSKLQRNLIFHLDPELAKQNTLLGFPSIPFNIYNFYKAYPILSFQGKRFARKMLKTFLNIDVFWDINKYSKDDLMIHLSKKEGSSVYFDWDNMASKILYNKNNLYKFINKSKNDLKNINILRQIFNMEIVFKEFENKI
jgi:hypothetical protein